MYDVLNELARAGVGSRRLGKHLPVMALTKMVLVAMSLIDTVQHIIGLLRLVDKVSIL